MKRPHAKIPTAAALALAALASAPHAPRADPALGVSEPPAVVYGRVVSPIGEREYVWTSGDLRWEIASPFGEEKSYHYQSVLAPLADGRFSYAIRIPTALLAFDLEVPEAELPLTGSGALFRHETITVDGLPCRLADPATESFALGQVERAGTFPVDLVVLAPETDQDGDGVPDWLERREGNDPYDSEDGASLLATLPPAGGADDPSSDGEDNLTDFAAWRTHHFPEDATPLDAFACADYDGDGICHLNEYAFVLDPKRPEPGAAWTAMPRIEQDAEGLVLVYRPRGSATDLRYVIEQSANFRDWRTANVTPLDNESGDGRARFRPATAPANEQSGFFRVRVQRLGGELSVADEER